MTRVLGIGLALLLTMSASTATPPPPVPREFRGLWVATVGNIDWPSKPGLSVAQQQEEMRQLMDGARRLQLNVVVFQVRTSCDALFDSPFEPWSEYLSGRMGVPPRPAWDPLSFAISEAHARGLELHAWFNPFRARYHQALSPISPSHVSRIHPEWIRRFGRYLWLDPGDPAVRDYALKVILDVARRYDVDGIHLDDYFYPYPEVVPGTSTPATFNDEATFHIYRNGGGRLERDDWRRENVNQFVQRLNERLHSIKPWIKFGISPFGIWRPKSPAGIKGLDAYATLFADSRRWLQAGWADYFAPQLYWPSNHREQDYGRLLEWWAGENTQGRLLVSGIASASVGKDRTSDDVIQQVRTRRTQLGTHGVLFWNASSLRNNLGGVATDLRREFHDESALPPELPWLGIQPPAIPGLSLSTARGGKGVELRWKPTGQVPVSLWTLQVRFGEQWRTDVIPGLTRRWEIDVNRRGKLPDEIWLRPVGRAGGLGNPAIWTRPVLSTPERNSHNRHRG